MKHNLAPNKILVISAVGIRSGGALEVLRACSESAEMLKIQGWRVIVLVGNSNLLKTSQNFEVLEFPGAKKSWIRRLHHEWFVFNRLSKKLQPDLWLSLHDITPIVCSRRQVVYCHNPSPFYVPTLREVFFDPKLFIFSCVYRWVYSIRQKRNYFVIVQQDWIRKKFISLFGTKRVVVAHPRSSLIERSQAPKDLSNQKVKRTIFFFPALPRVFKNFETIIDAIKLIKLKGFNNFEVRFTFTASESRYTRHLSRLIGDCSNVLLLGRLDRQEVGYQYENCDVVIFPSKLETWGLPISEAKFFGRQILAADLPYAYEAVGNYDLVSFINPVEPMEWAKAMIGCIEGTWTHSGCESKYINEPFARTWDELWPILIHGI